MGMKEVGSLSVDPKCNLNVGFVVCNIAVIGDTTRPIENFHAANVSDGTGCFTNSLTNRIFPTLARFTDKLDDFNDCHVRCPPSNGGNASIRRLPQRYPAYPVETCVAGAAGSTDARSFMTFSP